MSSGHQETSEALTTVSLHALFPPSASLRISLRTHTYVHTCRLSYTFRVARPGHALFSMCRVTCFVVPYHQTIIDMFVCTVLSQLHGCLCVLNSHSTLFPYVVFPFTSSLFKRDKPQIQYHCSGPLSHLSIHPCCDSRPELARFQLSSGAVGSVCHWQRMED